VNVLIGLIDDAFREAGSSPLGECLRGLVDSGVEGPLEESDEDENAAPGRQRGLVRPILVASATIAGHNSTFPARKHV
jgi:hypothetical protein